MTNKAKQLKISYVLPCYNIERFIADCLDSIYKQNLKEEEFEIICVNDCTPDRTRDIIVEYQKKHENLILIDHEKNKRVGAARNTGFYAAKGEYVWFIDPDDVITPDAIKDLLPVLDKDNLDFVQFGHDWMSETKVPNPNPPFNLNCPFDTEIMSGIDFIHEHQKRGLTYSDMHSGPFVRIYRREYLVDNNIIYPETAYYEDQYHALHGLVAAKRMRNVNKCYYHYREVVSSYSHVPMSVQKRASQLTMCTGMVKLMRKYNMSEEDINYVWKRYDSDFRYLDTHYVLFMPNKERTLFIDLIKEELPLLRQLHPQTNWLMTNCPNVYKLLANIFGTTLRKIRDCKRNSK